MSFKKGDRVEMTVKGEVLHGTVERAGATITAILDGGAEKLSGQASWFRPSSKPLPVEPPSAMDPYSVVSFKEHKALSEETRAFSATITKYGRKIAIVRNDGTGGSNRYDLVDRMAGRGILDELHVHAQEWGVNVVGRVLSEATDLWVEWFTMSRPYAVTAREYLADVGEIDRELPPVVEVPPALPEPTCSRFELDQSPDEARARITDRTTGRAVSVEHYSAGATMRALAALFPDEP